MTDVCVTVPKALWQEWIEEGDLPGDLVSGDAYHFWISSQPVPQIKPGERVYVVAHGKLRGYAPLVKVERYCRMRPDRACLLRHGGAEAVTIPESIRGFQGWRYRWWKREDELPFPDWKTESVEQDLRAFSHAVQGRLVLGEAGPPLSPKQREGATKAVRRLVKDTFQGSGIDAITFSTPHNGKSVTITREDAQRIRAADQAQAAARRTGRAGAG